MAVKVSPTSSSAAGASAAGASSASPSGPLHRTAKRVLKKYSSGGHGQSLADSSYSRLQKSVPTICRKDNISKLDVVLEAISYIQALQEQARAVAAPPAGVAGAKPSSRQC